MSMQSFLKKANQKLVVDPDADPTTDEESHATSKNQGPKSGGSAKSVSGGKPSPPAQMKKGTRKKI